MVKKKEKYSIAVILIICLMVIISYLCIGKNAVLTNIINQGKTLFAQIPTETDGTITYNTAGDDFANYEDGDKNKEKSHWVKNGDTWTYTFYVDDPNAEWYVYEDSSTLMDGYNGDHTEYNADKLFTEETLNEFTPTADMTVTTNSNNKNVYTWLDSENSYKVIDNGDGTYKKITTKLTLTVTNYKVSEGQTDSTDAITYGDLIINKIVKNNEGTVLDESEDSSNFVFTVILSADDNQKGLVEGTKIYGDTIFKDGVGTVSLKAGGSITIRGIPAGLSYSVKEKAIAGYDTICETNYYGIINEDTPEVVTYVNTKKQVESFGDQGGQSDATVNIVLKKVVIGNSELEEKYDFEIALDNLKPDTTYSLSNGNTFISDSVGSANISVKLGNNQTVTMENIPVGSKYKVFEHSGDYISSYLITDSNNLGLINNSAKANTKRNQDLATNTETADEGEKITILFTNKKSVTQNLKIQKIVTNEEDTNNYIFNIEFANMDEEASFNSTVGKISADSKGKSELTIYLSGGEEAEFYDIPVGITYKITELASSSIATYVIEDKNNINKIVSSSGANTEPKKALSTETETVNQGEDITVIFTNDTINQEPDYIEVSLGLKEYVIDEEKNKVENFDEDFFFEIIPENDNSPMPENNNVKITSDGEINFGTIKFTEPGTYTYKIIQKKGNTEDLEYDTTIYMVTYEITNPEGLLEVTKTVKKDGFLGNDLVFVNKISKSKENKENDDMDNQNIPKNEENENIAKDNTKKEDNNKENIKIVENGGEVNRDNENIDDTAQEQIKNLTKNIKTGDNIFIYVLILFISLLIIIVLKIKMKNK